MALKTLEEQIESTISVALKANKEQDLSIYYKFAENKFQEMKEKREDEEKKSIPSYIGEFVIFLFYGSITFLILSVSPIFNVCLCIKLLITTIIIIFLFWAAQKDFVVGMMKNILDPLSHLIFKKNR